MSKPAQRSAAVPGRAPERLAVALLAVLCHLPVLWGGFIWLDHGDIELGTAIAPPSGWLELFARGFARTGFYRPAMALSLSLDALGGAPWAYHLDNLLWHAGAAVLVVAAGECLGLSRRAAVTAGMLFAVHPVTGLVANAISYRADAIVAVALLGLLISHARGWAPLAAVAMLGGSLAKETALVLGPAFVLALEIGFGGRLGPLRQRARLLAAEALGLGGALALRLAFAPPWRASFHALSPSEAFGARAAALAKSAVRMLVPFDASICDAFPIVGALHPTALAGLGVAVAIGSLAARRRGPALLFGLAMLPSLSLVPVPRFWSPHYLYLPAALLSWMVAEQIARAAQGRLRSAAFGAFSVVVLGLACFSAYDASRYVSDRTLFEPEVAAQPACREAHLYLADERLRGGDLENAAEGYLAAARPAVGFISYSSEATAWQNLGLVRLRQGRLEEAEEAVRAAQAYPGEESERRKLTHNLAAVEAARGSWEQAARLLSAECDREDALAESILLRARALHELGRAEESRALVSRLRQRISQ
ncbi:MAG: hypothetical protein HYZ28_26240 [Myxococcales bacterium]|nr:hypothetical protein [Myxococcales bacterium]